MTDTSPKLLKSRQSHSRWFAVAFLLLLLISAPQPGGSWVGHEIAKWIGLFLIILCGFGRAYCSTFIGGIKNERVVRDGPFSVVRNPLYVFSFLGVIGIGLSSGMLTVLVLLVGAFALYYPQVVGREEAFLHSKFGEPYRLYCEEVPRWWPNWSLWSEPEEVTARPRFIRRTMRDAAMFFLALPAFELLEQWHLHGTLPTYLTLP